MDPVKILKRAWHILWNYRALWVFGLILALATAGSYGGGGGNNGSRFQYNADQTDMQRLPDNIRQGIEEFTQGMEKLFREGPGHVNVPQEQITALIWIVVVFVLVMLVFGIIVAIGRYVSETAVMRMVNEYEESDTKMTVREGFRIGWSRTSWRLFLINLIVNLPGILLMLVFISGGIGIFFAVRNGNLTFAPLSIVVLIGLVFLLIFVVVIATIFLHLFRHFVWRVSALEEVGVQEAFSRGWALVRENWKEVGLMWLVMIGLGIAWAIASIILFFISIPLLIVTGAIALVISAIPALLLVGLFHLFLGNALAWVLGIVMVLPLFFTIAFSPWLLVGGWQSVFTSSVWTLTYREIKAMPNSKAEVAEIPATS